MYIFPKFQFLVTATGLEVSTLKNDFLKKIIQNFRTLKKNMSLCKSETNQINEIENKNEEMIFEYINLQGY